MATVMRQRRSTGAVTSPARVQAAKDAAAARDEAEGRLRELERAVAEHERLVARVNEERRAQEGPLVDMMVFPSLTAARERGHRGLQLRSELAIAEDNLRRRTQEAQDAERAAKPLSAAAARRLRQVAADVAADDELLEVGIPIQLLAGTPPGRAHLRALAAEYGLGGGA
jgi:hypothetical protein